MVVRNFEKFNKEYYSTGSYSDYFKRFRRDGLTCINKLIKAVSPRPSWSFLDVGCGMGGFVWALRKLGFKARGVEVSPYCLGNSPVKKWIKFGDIRKLPFKNNSFDVIICCDMLQYLKKREIKKALQELSRISKRFIFTDIMCDGSANNSQLSNPDDLREKVLPKKEELVKILRKENFELIRPLFKEGKFAWDFNGVFRKLKG